jgi:hypothetical protein
MVGPPLSKAPRAVGCASTLSVSVSQSAHPHRSSNYLVHPPALPFSSRRRMSKLAGHCTEAPRFTAVLRMSGAGHAPGNTAGRGPAGRADRRGLTPAQRWCQSPCTSEPPSANRPSAATRDGSRSGPVSLLIVSPLHTSYQHGVGRGERRESPVPQPSATSEWKRVRWGTFQALIGPMNSRERMAALDRPPAGTCEAPERTPLSCLCGGATAAARQSVRCI